MGIVKSKGRRRDGTSAGIVPVDLHRAFVFPNRVREQRCNLGYAKLLRLAATIPDIPYIRLSKIERGEVVPRPDELRRIAGALGIAASELLLDVDAPDFDIAVWAHPFCDGTAADVEQERFAVLLAAALRTRRASDPALTIAAIERDYGLPPVNLSRVENAQKPFARWSDATRRALFALFGVEDEAQLCALVEAQYSAGGLDPLLRGIGDPGVRHQRTRARIAEVAAALRDAENPAPAPTPAPAAAMTPRLVPVLGTPLPQGLIADSPTGEFAEAPRTAGGRAFALKVCRATLGAGLPGQAIVIADPDRLAVPGGLAALREDDGWRLLSVGSARDGRMVGYSCHPELEIALDDCDPARVVAVIAAIFP